jgi:hypothetical protein
MCDTRLGKVRELALKGKRQTVKSSVRRSSNPKGYPCRSREIGRKYWDELPALHALIESRPISGRSLRGAERVLPPSLVASCLLSVQSGVVIHGSWVASRNAKPVPGEGIEVLE